MKSKKIERDMVAFSLILKHFLRFNTADFILNIC